MLAPFAAQVNNGQVLNQTVWNWYFETGTDKLTPAGRTKLDSIAQTRPQPDGRELYLQAARDVVVYGAGEHRTRSAPSRSELRRPSGPRRSRSTWERSRPSAATTSRTRSTSTTPRWCLAMPADFRPRRAYLVQRPGSSGIVGGICGDRRAEFGPRNRRRRAETRPAALRSGTGPGGGNPSGPAAGPAIRRGRRCGTAPGEYGWPGTVPPTGNCGIAQPRPGRVAARAFFAPLAQARQFVSYGLLAHHDGRTPMIHRRNRIRAFSP